MKKLFNILLFIVIVGVGKMIYSQAVTVAPSTDAQLTVLNATSSSQLSEAVAASGIMGQTLDIQSELKNARESFDWAKNLKMIVRIEKLIESMYCTVKTMNLYLGISGDLGCFAEIEMNQSLLSYQSALSFVKVAIGAGALAMTSGERIKTLDAAVNQLEIAVRKIREFNINQKLRINSLIKQTADNEVVRPLFLIRKM